MTYAAAIVDALGGIATRAQILARGASGSDITADVRLGLLRRVRRAHYSTPDAKADAVIATRVGGFLVGLSAARSYGLWSGTDRRVHVGVKRNASRLRTVFVDGQRTVDVSPAVVAIHWIDDAPGRECWRVPLPTCLRQVVAWCDRETAVACLDTAMTEFGISRQQVRRLFLREPPASRVTCELARPGSGSGPESLVRQRLDLVRIVVDQQVRIPGVGRVDMVIRGTRIVIEIDGFEFHRSREQFEQDRRRDAILLGRGYVVLRFTYRQVTEDWGWCLEQITAALSLFRNSSD